MEKIITFTEEELVGFVNDIIYNLKSPSGRRIQSILNEKIRGKKIEEI